MNDIFFYEFMLYSANIWRDFVQVGEIMIVAYKC